MLTPERRVPLGRHFLEHMFYFPRNRKTGQKPVFVFYGH